MNRTIWHDKVENGKTRNEPRSVSSSAAAAAAVDGRK